MGGVPGGRSAEGNAFGGATGSSGRALGNICPAANVAAVSASRDVLDAENSDAALSGDGGVGDSGPVDFSKAARREDVRTTADAGASGTASHNGPGASAVEG